MSWIITGSFAQPDEPEALAYIAAVEAADGQTLEDGVKFAYNSFIKGCKADGIWDAIKASCILAGARTLDGALVPLVGTAPTNYNFVSGDYNRETGLIGDGSTKYLDSNYSQSSQPQDSRHVSVYIGEAQAESVTTSIFLFAQDASNIRTSLYMASSLGTVGYSASTGNVSADTYSATSNQVGFLGHSRSQTASYNARIYGSTTTKTIASTSASASNYGVFGRLPSAGSLLGFGGRISFYSIGESLDLAALDTRVTTLMSDLAAAIP